MEKAIKYLLGAFITLMLGLVLLMAYSDMSSGVTQVSTKTQTISIAGARLAGGTINTTYPITVSNGYDTWRSDYPTDCLPTTLTYANSTGGAYTVTTDYTYTSTTGKILLKNTAAMNNSVSNTTTATYTYCQDGYIPSGWGQSMQKVTVGLLAVLLLSATVGFLTIAYREMKVG